MFNIPNTTIANTLYDIDSGGSGQTFVANQLLTGGYLFCSTAAVMVRLTAGPIGQQRPLPEFFLSPGSQGISVDQATGGNPISKIEVRLAVAGTAAQFWGTLATASDPVGSFYPASYQVSAAGVIVPQVIVLTAQQDGVNKSARAIMNFTAVGGVPWNISDDVPGTRITVPVPGIGVQVADAGQLNRQIIDFQNAGGISWGIVDDPANNRVKVTGTATTTRELGYTESSATATISATTEATANTVVTAPAINFDGATPCIVSFYASRFRATSAVAIEIAMVLFDGASAIGQTMDHNITETTQPWKGPIFWQRRLTPSAGSHTFSARAFVNANSAVIAAGPGGAGQLVPLFIRVERAA